MSGPKPFSTELSRELSLFHITMMGLGMMIGAGVFIGIGNAVRVAGPGGALLTFALNGLIALFTAMSYAELSSAIPKAGGAYNFARIAFGKGTSFVAGWMEWFASSVAGSLYAVTFALYTVRYLIILLDINLTGPARLLSQSLLAWTQLAPETIEALMIKLIALLVACFFIYINYRGAAETGKIGAIFTLGQTIFLVVIGLVGVIVGFTHPSRLENLQPFLPAGWSALLVTMGFTYVAFEGYEVIAQAGDEAINPKQNLPKAMIYSVAIVTFTYVAVAFATLVAVKASPDLAGDMGPYAVDAGPSVAPWQWIASHGPKGFGESIARLLPFGNFLLTLAVIFASTSALNATVYSATRAAYALGRDRMLPKVFALISPIRKTPSGALMFTAVIVVLVATCLPTEEVACSASIMFLMLFFLVNLCVIMIRRNMSDELNYGFIMPFFPFFPVAAIILQGVLAIWMIHMSLLAWIIAPAWILAGVAIYHFYSKSRSADTEHGIQVLEEAKAPEGDEQRIMIAVANPDNALSLIKTTYRICKAMEARIELLHMVPVPSTTPLAVAQEQAWSHAWTGKEAIAEASLYLNAHFPLSTTIRYCRSIARGIVSAVREKDVDLLMLGWHGRETTQHFSMGSTIDPIIEQTPCRVVILKDVTNQNFKRVLVPLAGGRNSPFALEMANIMADPADGGIVAFSVDAGRQEFDIQKFVDQQIQQTSMLAGRLRAETMKAHNVVDAILAKATEYDLIVLGCTDQPLMHHFATQSVPELIAQRTDKPVVMVKTAGGIRSWLKRWF